MLLSEDNLHFRSADQNLVNTIKTKSLSPKVKILFGMLGMIPKGLGYGGNF